MIGRYKMKVTLSNWDISMAIFDYLEKHYGLSNESYFDGLEMFIEKQSKNLIDEDYIKEEFEKDQVWKEDKLKTLKEYELEGVYIKRKKKGAKNYTYIKLEKKHMRDIIDLTDKDISFYIESEY